VPPADVLLNTTPVARIERDPALAVISQLALIVERNEAGA
jgi:hypothetical protein